MATQITVEQVKTTRAGIFNGIADMVRRVSFEIGVSPPNRAWFLHSEALSPKEKTELTAYLMGF